MTSSPPQPRPTTTATLRTVLWCIWVCGALYATLHHTMWRDEIRALSFARQGDDLIEMIGLIRGFGHPALWHVMLRSALSLHANPMVLAVLAFLIGAAASALLAFRAPFRPLMLALALFGAFSIYEYVAVARNYGLSVLLLFLIAAAWRRYRDRPGVIGALLFLLCNANVHSVVLAGALLLFWLVELVREETGSRLAWPSFIAAAALALAGAATCAWQVYPPVDSAAALPPSPLNPLALLTSLAINLGPAFDELMPEGLRTLIPVVVILPLLLLLSITSLRASPAAVLAAASALLGMTLLFGIVYPGFYRHQALFIAFLLTLTWIVQDRQPPPASGRDAGGRMALMTLLALQLYASVEIFVRIAGGIPESRSADLAALLARPELRDAIVMGDPDTMLEPIPYYAGNPVYLARERRFGTTVTFSHAAESTMSVGKLLSTARNLQARTGRPVVIVMQERLDPGMAAGERARGYYGPLRIDPAEVRRFLSETRRIARFAPAVTDESYDVYVLRNDPGR